MSYLSQIINKFKTDLTEDHLISMIPEKRLESTGVLEGFINFVAQLCIRAYISIRTQRCLFKDKVILETILERGEKLLEKTESQQKINLFIKQTIFSQSNSPKLENLNLLQSLVVKHAVNEFSQTMSAIEGENSFTPQERVLFIKLLTNNSEPETIEGIKVFLSNVETECREAVLNSLNCILIDRKRADIIKILPNLIEASCLTNDKLNIALNLLEYKELNSIEDIYPLVVKSKPKITLQVLSEYKNLSSSLKATLPLIMPYLKGSDNSENSQYPDAISHRFYQYENKAFSPLVDVKTFIERIKTTKDRVESISAILDDKFFSFAKLEALHKECQIDVAGVKDTIKFFKDLGELEWQERIAQAAPFFSQIDTLSGRMSILKQVNYYLNSSKKEELKKILPCIQGLNNAEIISSFIHQCVQLSNEQLDKLELLKFLPFKMGGQNSDLEKILKVMAQVPYEQWEAFLSIAEKFMTPKTSLYTFGPLLEELWKIYKDKPEGLENAAPLVNSVDEIHVTKHMKISLLSKFAQLSTESKVNFNKYSALIAPLTQNLNYLQDSEPLFITLRWISILEDMPHQEWPEIIEKVQILTRGFLNPVDRQSVLEALIINEKHSKIKLEDIKKIAQLIAPISHKSAFKVIHGIYYIPAMHREKMIDALFHSMIRVNWPDLEETIILMGFIPEQLATKAIDILYNLNANSFHIFSEIFKDKDYAVKLTSHWLSILNKNENSIESLYLTRFIVNKVQNTYCELEAKHPLVQKAMLVIKHSPLTR